MNHEVLVTTLTTPRDWKRRDSEMSLIKINDKERKSTDYTSSVGTIDNDAR